MSKQIRIISLSGKRVISDVNMKRGYNVRPDGIVVQYSSGDVDEYVLSRRIKRMKP